MEKKKRDVSLPKRFNSEDVKRGLTNNGLSVELADKICKIAENYANEFQLLKAK